LTVRETAPTRAGAGLALALSFLTILPVRGRAHAGAGLGAAAGWFPLVGALVGALAGGVRVGLEPLIGTGPATVLALTALVVVTGALHQDGLADTADALGVRGDRERRLAVMRDSATGAFGALALVGWALLMLTALAPLSQGHALAALVAAGSLSRWAALLHAAGTPPARADGLGAAFTIGRLTLGLAGAVAIAIAVVAAGAAPGGAAAAAALTLALLSCVAARRAIGGRTGDTIGATVALVEAAVCTVLLGCWRP
jgi:adenosylcobinamide-GDP ribazoletransferase